MAFGTTLNVPEEETAAIEVMAQYFELTDRPAEAVEVEPNARDAGLQYSRRQPSAITARAARRDIVRDRRLLVTGRVLPVSRRAPDFNRLRIIGVHAADVDTAEMILTGVRIDFGMICIWPDEFKAEEIDRLLAGIFDFEVDRSVERVVTAEARRTDVRERTADRRRRG